MTNTLPAGFGATGGGAVCIVGKSGTNTAHGSGYEYLRGSGLDANNFFANRSGIPPGSFRRDQFRGAFGGPAALPTLPESTGTAV